MIKEKIFRTPYNLGKPHEFAIEFLDEKGLPSTEEKPHYGKTEQCHKDMCDIRKIIEKYDKDGIITHVNKAVARYGVDYTEVNEYQNKLNFVNQAKEDFAKLDSSIRDKYRNDPGNFFEFATNPENAEELIKMGLANPPEIIKEDPPIKVEVTNPKAPEEAK